MEPEISPYFYATHIALVDDNQPFLNTLHLYLARFFHCHMFANPSEALRFVNDRSVIDSLYSGSSVSLDSDVFKPIQEKWRDPSKYHELSVVVVDYDMPELNGIEFCARIKDPSVRKILLTGQATQRQVVTAFNENIIDYYIHKQEDNLLASVRTIVDDMQKQYFKNKLRQLTLSLVHHQAPYFLDSAMADFFDETCRDLAVQEHYFLPRPSRFVLRSVQTDTLLLVLSDNDLDEHITIIREEEGPQDWIRCLQSRQYVPYFESSSDGFYSPESLMTASPFIKATVIEGQQTYYCALIHKPRQSCHVSFAGFDVPSVLH